MGNMREGREAVTLVGAVQARKVVRQQQLELPFQNGRDLKLGLVREICG